ncbi:MAG: hypothetical protein S4CHLAM6_02080 [Chlamydiae bacterium]|nr:hypothetical protein [Chlamydiota bacterium]
MTKSEQCFGIIPLRVEGDELQVLLALHVKGDYWAFPKGHGESEEKGQVAAQRELFEETDLKVHSFINVNYPEESYSFKRDGFDIHKSVVYYPACIEGEIVIKEPHEVKEAKWFSIDDALGQITFEQSKKLLKNLIQENPDLDVKVREG